jgi:hypothetical protein
LLRVKKLSREEENEVEEREEGGKKVQMGQKRDIGDMQEGDGGKGKRVTLKGFNQGKP